MFCKKVGCLLAFVAVVICGQAEPVSSALVVKAVDSWIAQKAQMECPIEGKVSSVRLHTLTNGAAFYVAKLTGGGFVVASTDTEIDPVIAFSPSSDLVEDPQNPLWALLVRDMAVRQRNMAERTKPSLRLSMAGSGGASASSSAPISAAARRWASLTASGAGASASGPAPAAAKYYYYSGMKSVSDVRVAPLVKTKWGQSKDASGANCFNYYTPNHYVCGCTATASAQILRYHKFPTEAVEPQTYECRVNGKWCMKTQKGGVYSWKDMPNVPGSKTTTAQRKAIGKLTYDVSLAVDSSYSAYSTWGYMDRFVDLCLEWGYAHAKSFSCYDWHDDWDDDWDDEWDDDWDESSNIRGAGGYYYDEGFSEEGLMSVLVPNLDAGLPVGVRIYSAYDDNLAHFVVADGYGYSYGQFSVHLNMGWDGDCDAWYVLPDVSVGMDRYTSIDYLYGNIYPQGPEYGAIISGRVLFAETEKPAVGVVVTARDSWGDVQQTTTNAKGIYAFVLPEDDWEVCLENATANSSPDVYSTTVYDSENEHGVDFWLVTHTVSFDANGGSCDKTAKENCYATVGALPTPTRAGYTFSGWFTEANGGTEVTESTLVTDDVTYYAHWTANAYTVVFDANGGAGSMEPMTFVYDQAQTLRPNAFVNGDEEFRGWTFSPKRRRSYEDGDLAMNLAESGSVTLYAVWGEGQLQVKVGEYVKWPLEELGFQVPTDGSVYNVTAYGLPSGLKLVKSPAVTKKVKDKKTGKTKTVVVTPAGVDWWIEGVATAAVDYKTNPAYLTVTAGGTNYSAAVVAETLPQDVVELGEIPVGVALNEQHWLPGLGSGWSVSGLPAGLKYTAKLVTTKKTTTVGKKKVTTVTTNALPDSVYGKPTKAGLFAITAKKKVSGFYETLKYRVVVTPNPADAELFGDTLESFSTMAYLPFEWNLADDVAAVGGAVVKVTGLPTGLSFAAKDTYAYLNAKKKTGKYLKQAGQTIVGTPTKTGTFVVTFTKNVKSGKKTIAKTAQILWTVIENDNPPEMYFNTDGGKIAAGSVGLAYKDMDLLAFSATEGAKVTASGLPKGISLVDLCGGLWGFKGFTTKAGMYLVTVKATMNGRTVSQRLALNVEGLPAWAKGTFNAAFNDTYGNLSGMATLSVTSAGKISGKFSEHGTNWTFSASSYTGYEYESEFSLVATAKSAYKVKSGKKTVTKYLTRDITLSVIQGELGGCAFLYADDGAYADLRQNLWGSTYKALGKKLFYASKKAQYRTYKTNVFGTNDLSLKVTPAGAVTATLTWDTGRKDKKKKTIFYKPTCATVLLPTCGADEPASSFSAEVYLYFAPSAANNFEGFADCISFPFGE